MFFNSIKSIEGEWRERILYVEGLDGDDYLIDNIQLVEMATPTAAPTQKPNSDEKFLDPDFEISPSWSLGWGCKVGASNSITPTNTPTIVGRQNRN